MTFWREAIFLLSLFSLCFTTTTETFGAVGLTGNAQVIWRWLDAPRGESRSPELKRFLQTQNSRAKTSELLRDPCHAALRAAVVRHFMLLTSDWDLVGVERADLERMSVERNENLKSLKFVLPASILELLSLESVPEHRAIDFILENERYRRTLGVGLWISMPSTSPHVFMYVGLDEELKFPPSEILEIYTDFYPYGERIWDSTRSGLVESQSFRLRDVLPTIVQGAANPEALLNELKRVGISIPDETKGEEH